MARVEITGGVTRVNDPKPVYDRWVVNFSIAESGVRWNPETRQDEIASTFWEVAWWTDTLDPANMLFKGDKVWIVGELTQQPGRDGSGSHTRISPYIVQVTRRSRAGAEHVRSLEGGDAPAPSRQPATSGDPWDQVPTPRQQWGTPEEPPF